MDSRLISSSRLSSSIFWPVFESKWMWYPAAEALTGERASESFMNSSLSAANLWAAGDSDCAGDCCEDQGSRVMSTHSVAQKNCDENEGMGFLSFESYRKRSRLGRNGGRFDQL